MLLKGSGLADETAISTSPLKNQLAGASVVLGGTPVSLLYADSGQVLGLVPLDASPVALPQLILARTAHWTSMVPWSFQRLIRQFSRQTELDRDKARSTKPTAPQRRWPTRPTRQIRATALSSTAPVWGRRTPTGPLRTRPWCTSAVYRRQSLTPGRRCRRTTRQAARRHCLVGSSPPRWADFTNQHNRARRDRGPGPADNFHW